MSTLQQAINTYEQDLKNQGINFDLLLLENVVKSCGPSIYLPNSSRISTSDEKELINIKENFLIKKLGLKDSTELDKTFADVIEKFRSTYPNKYRAVFYYLLTKKFEKTNVFKNKESIGLSNYYNKIVKEDNNLLKRLAK